MQKIIKRDASERATAGSRKDKLALVERDNPPWADLYETVNGRAVVASAYGPRDRRLRACGTVGLVDQLVDDRRRARRGFAFASPLARVKIGFDPSGLTSVIEVGPRKK